MASRGIIDVFRCAPGLAAMALCASVAAQGLPPPPPPQQLAPVQQPTPKGNDPLPEDAIKAIGEAFARYEVVALDAGHGKQDLDAFLLDFFRSKGFPGTINDVVVECGNSLYQPLLDRYMAGDAIGTAEIRPVWRNTTQPMCGTSGFYEQLFPVLRRVNQRLPAQKRIRVLAGNPPIDWNTIRTRDELLRAPSDRDGSIAAVMEKEVLSRHRRALMLFGTAHLFHGPMADGSMSAVGLYEKRYPGKTLVVVDHDGFGNGTGYEPYNHDFEARLAPWPVPSLATNLQGTWLASLLDTTYSTGNVMFTTTKGANGKTEVHSVPAQGKRQFSSMADAYLYLGPRDLLLDEPAPAEVFLDTAYMAEMKRRAALMGGGPVADQADPGSVSEAGFDPFLYDAAEK